MPATLTLLNLLGAIALLLWGTGMVQRGITRALGARLRAWVGVGMRSPVTALASGVGVTLLLQSSTATAMLMATLASRGLVETAPALAVLLGADVGTTLVAQLLTLDLSWLSPVLLLLGVLLHRSARGTGRQNLAEAAVGIGLLLLGLRLIVQVSAPLRGNGVLPLLLPLLQGDPVILALAGALLAWAAHSSLATVLLIIALGNSGVVPLPVALALVVGINVGGVLPALVGTLAEPPAARRLPLGNLFFKLCGAALALPLLPTIAEGLHTLGGGAGRQIAHFHMGFNLVLALGFLFFTRPVARLLHAIWPDPDAEATQPQYLDEKAIKSPSVAIALAEQETLRMGDLVEGMFRDTLRVIQSSDPDASSTVSARDDDVDRINEAIKLYLTKVSREALSEKESRRIIDIIAFATNLEHVGDIIDKNLMELCEKKVRKQLHFSSEGLAEITALHEKLLGQFALASNVFLTGDVEMARRLHGMKTAFRDSERQAAEQHLARLRQGKMESIDTSSIHLDVLRDLKRINSHLIAVVYPILHSAGQLWNTRLKD